jgi:hypothetical protein
MRIAGSCHCRNIRFELHWLPEPVMEIPARACGCTFCTRHGGVWTSCPTGELSVSIEDDTLRSRYAFGTGTADFHVCARCGVVPVVTSRIDGTTYAVVNVNAFEGIDRSLLRQAPASFDDEDEPSRLARRQRSWIGRVTFTGGDA